MNHRTAAPITTAANVNPRAGAQDGRVRLIKRLLRSGKAWSPDFKRVSKFPDRKRRSPFFVSPRMRDRTLSGMSIIGFFEFLLLMALLLHGRSDGPAGPVQPRHDGAGPNL
jgi:hypothetical protein